MRLMFYVRFTSALPFTQSRPPLHTLRAPNCTAQSPAATSSFNQPVNFDTSNVTDMDHMFHVCLPRCPAPQSVQSRHPLHAARTAVARRLPPLASRPAARPAPCALLATPPQHAHSFNQPLSFDTTRLATMNCMFCVRASSSPSCSPPPKSAVAPSVLHAACTAVARHLPPPGQQFAPRTVCPAYDPRQSASAFNQPLSFDTSSVTNMRSMFEVRSAARALPPQPPQSLVLHVNATCARHCPTRPSSPAFRPAHLGPHRKPCLRPRQGAAAFNQPVSFDTSRVTSIFDMFLVRSPRVLCPHSPPVAGHRKPCFRLGRPRRPSTS